MVVDTAASTALKITCSRDELSQAVQLVGRAVSARTSVQILAGMLLTAESDELGLAATDMEMSLRASLRVSVEESGSVIVPGRLEVVEPDVQPVLLQPEAGQCRELLDGRLAVVLAQRHPGREAAADQPAPPGVEQAQAQRRPVDTADVEPVAVPAGRDVRGARAA